MNLKRINSYTEFGLWMKTELLKRNLTQRELAQMTGLNYRVISDVLTGQNKSHEERMRRALEAYDMEKKAG